MVFVMNEGTGINPQASSSKTLVFPADCGAAVKGEVEGKRAAGIWVCTESSVKRLQ